MDFNCGVFIVCLQEPSLFAVAKLLETGLVNMDRIEILWRPLTGHLLEVKSVAKCTHLSQYKQLNAPKELFIFRGSILMITLLPLWAGAWLHLWEDSCVELCVFKTILRSYIIYIFSCFPLFCTLTVLQKVSSDHVLYNHLLPPSVLRWSFFSPQSRSKNAVLNVSVLLCQFFLSFVLLHIQIVICKWPIMWKCTGEVLYVQTKCHFCLVYLQLHIAIWNTKFDWLEIEQRMEK